MDTGHAGLDELAAACDKRGAVAYVRATISHGGDGSVVRYIAAVVGPKPPGWNVSTWRYPTAEFVSREVPAADLGRWVAQGGHFPTRDVAAVRPELQPQANWIQRPSLYRYADVRLPWPCRDWTLNAISPPNGINDQWQPREMLVSETAPTFALFQVAHRAFYLGDFSSVGAHQMPSDFGHVWVAETGAWLHRLQLGERFVDVTVRGDAPLTTRVDLVGAAGRFSKPVGSTRKVRIRLPDGVGSDAWLYLVDGKRCWDYRVLGDHQIAQAELTRQGVEFVVPDDPDAQLSSIIGRPESDRLDYKGQLPEKDGVGKVMKTVAAFATGAGGDIVFGVDRDEITLVGLQLKDPLAERDRMYHLVRDWVTPAPDVEIDVVEYDGKTFMILSVPAGPEPPYALPGPPPKYFVRRGTHTVPARPEELRQAWTARQAAPEPQAGNDWRYGL